MRFLEGAIVAGVFIASNVVAAGVVLVLGMMLKLSPVADSPWPWLVVGILGALAAYVFLKGAMLYDLHRRFFGWRNPNKGLQSGAGRRGG